MWVNRRLFDMIVNDNAMQAQRLVAEAEAKATTQSAVVEVRAQKAKDDITIDWMRHRINALEKQNAQLLMKAAGIIVSVPEIVPARPGTISDMSQIVNALPNFEDVGDDEAEQLGIRHELDGSLKYTK